MLPARFFAFLTAVVVIVAAQQDAARAEPGDDLVGTWEGTAGGFKETWVITRTKDGLAVAGTFKSDDKEVGAFRGTMVSLDGGTLKFRQEYSRKPQASWTDGNQMTAHADGDKLSVTWKAGKQSGKTTLTRQTGAVADKKDTTDKKDAKVAVADKKDPPVEKNPNPKVAGKKEAKTPDKKDTAVADKKDAKPLDEATLKELGKFDGKWKFDKLVLDGKTLDYGVTWQFKGEKVVETFGGLQRRAGTVKLDLEKKPKEIDLNFNDGKGGGMTGVLLGVYEVEGDKLTICLGTDGKRPSELASKPDSKSMLIVGQRTK